MPDSSSPPEVRTQKRREISGPMLGFLVSLPGAFWAGLFLTIDLLGAREVGATSEAMAWVGGSLIVCLLPVGLIPLFSPRRVGAYHVLAPVLAGLVQFVALVLNAY
ncbi:hypothetical protein ACSDQ9_11180 [Aestuariimicrobium soli]|uniref:hypothetical protein n=1 Tax=Aestuariimicrobium soli TaxID=2035834 RepID=UPI003EB79CA5